MTPVEATAREFLARFDEGPRLQDMGVEESREAFEQVCLTIGPKGPDTVRAEDLEIPGPEGDLHLRLYHPTTDSAEPLPVLLFIHGGGFEMGSVAAYDGWCRFFAHHSGHLTVSVDYRLVPEHPFPAAVDDTWAALRWVHEEISAYGGDPTAVAVGGDSAGGSLAAALPMRFRSSSRPALTGQMLIMPCTDFSDDSPSMEEVADGKMFVTRQLFQWTRERYLGPDFERLRFDPMASPLRAMDCSDAPPTLIITAEYDPVRDQGEAYGQRLVQEGVPVTMHRYVGQIHGFMHVAGVIPVGYDALHECARWLRTLSGKVSDQQVEA